MISARTMGFVVAAALGATLLSGCMSMMMSAEQKQQMCDSQVSMLNMPELTAEQRKQTISGMKQMGCENIPAS